MDGPLEMVFELAVTPGQAAEVRALIGEMVESTRAEPGTLVYEWFVSDDGRAVQLVERFADSAAALAHLATFGERFAGRLLALAAMTRVAVLGDPSAEVRDAVAAFGPAYLRPVGGFAR